jgi:LPXTG-motif cell wall-anchored protein
MIKQSETAKVEAPPPIIQPPAPAPMPEAQAAPPEPAPAPPEEIAVIEEKALPRTGSDIPLLGLGGLFALGAAFAIRRFRTE